MSDFMSEIQGLTEKYKGVKSIPKVEVKEDLALLNTYAEISPNLTEDNIFVSIQSKLSKVLEAFEDEDEEENLEFDMEMDHLEGELGPEEETFTNKYPNVDADSLLVQAYDNFILSVKEKTFYKTIENYYELQTRGALNFVERKFLWRFLKAISSAITHLLIEGEQKEESITLVDKYYDSLVTCMNKVVHAADKQDVIQAFNYMIEFLGIAEPDEISSSDEAAIDDI